MTTSKIVAEKFGLSPLAITPANRWQTVAQFWVPGVPKPGGSKKGFVNRHTGRVNKGVRTRD